MGPRWAKLGPKRGQDHILKRLGSSSREDDEKMSCPSRFKVVLRRSKSHLDESFSMCRAVGCRAKGSRGGGGGEASSPPETLATFGSSDDTKSHTSVRLGTFTFVGRFRDASRRSGPRRYREAYWVRSGLLSFGKVWHRWLSEARLDLAGLL